MNRNSAFTNKPNAKMAGRASANNKQAAVNPAAFRRVREPEVLHSVVLGDMARAQLYQASPKDTDIQESKQYGQLFTTICADTICKLAGEGVTRFEVLFDFDQDKIRIRSCDPESFPQSMEAELSPEVKEKLEAINEQTAARLSATLTNLWKARVHIQRLEYIDDDSYDEFDDDEDYSDEEGDSDDDMSDGEDDGEDEEDDGEDDEDDEDDDEELEDAEDDDDEEESEDDAVSNGGVSILISLF
jgi:hypothetical protein